MVFLLRSTDQKSLENDSSTARSTAAEPGGRRTAAPNTQAAKEVSNTAAKAPAHSDPEKQSQPASLLPVQAAGGDPAGKEASVKVTPAPARETKEQSAAVTRQAQTLAQSLRSVFSRRTTPETETKELVTRCRTPELEPAQRPQAQEQLRAELAEQQKRPRGAGQEPANRSGQPGGADEGIGSRPDGGDGSQSPARERDPPGAEAGRIAQDRVWPAHGCRATGGGTDGPACRIGAGTSPAHAGAGAIAGGTGGAASAVGRAGQEPAERSGQPGGAVEGIGTPRRRR